MGRGARGPYATSSGYDAAKAQKARDQNKRRKGGSHGRRSPVEADDDLEDLEDDPELHALHKERIQQMKEEHEKRREMQSKGHGTYVDVNEQEFLPEVTSAFQVCCHFYHQEFERCRIVDKHMNILAQKYFDTKFIKIHAPDAPFFVDKLQIQVLPCIVFFRNGVAYDRIVGFEELGARDDFPTAALTMFRAATGEDWNGIMHDCMATSACVEILTPVGPYVAGDYADRDELAALALEQAFARGILKPFGEPPRE